jgi:hypothetical protein
MRVLTILHYHPDRLQVEYQRIPCNWKEEYLGHIAWTFQPGGLCTGEISVIGVGRGGIFVYGILSYTTYVKMVQLVLLDLWKGRKPAERNSLSFA